MVVDPSKLEGTMVLPPAVVLSGLSGLVGTFEVSGTVVVSGAFVVAGAVALSSEFVVPGTFALSDKETLRLGGVVSIPVKLRCMKDVSDAAELTSVAEGAVVILPSDAP